MSFLWPCCDFPPCLPQSEKKNVKMMNQNGLFRIGFVDELKAQILELPYTKGKLDMVVLLPSGSAPGDDEGQGDLLCCCPRG